MGTIPLMWTPFQIILCFQLIRVYNNNIMYLHVLHGNFQEGDPGVYPLCINRCGGIVSTVLYNVPYRATTKNPQNQKILSKLIKEVKTLKQSLNVDVVDIRSNQKSKLFRLACVILIYIL